MRMHRAVRGVVLVVLAAVCVSLPAQEKPEDKAQRSDESWLALVDAGKYGESWKASSPMFQAAVTEATWTKAMESVRTPMGKLESRKLASAVYSKTLPGAPDGEYVVIQFKTSFVQKKDAIETVISSLDKDGSWKLAGYYIK